MTTLRARVLSPISPTEVEWIPDAVVVIDGTVISEVSAYDGRPVDDDLRPAVLTPGFVDSHVHFPQTRIVGAATGPLLEWLAKSTFPEEQRFEDPVFAAKIATLFCDRLVAAGTTLAMVYGSVHPAASAALFAEVERRGLRVIGGPVLMDRDCPEALRFPVDRAIPALEKLISDWHGRDGRIELAVVPRFALSTSMELMKAGGELAQRHGLWVTTHLSENTVECQIATEMYGTADYLQVYEDAGLLHERSVYAHCIHLSDSEWDRFARAGATVAHCPDSNFFLGSGNMPIAKVQERGIAMALGSDIAAGRSFRIPRIASSAYDNGLMTGVTLDPRRLLWWATAGGAAALGHPELGRIAAGQEADLVALTVPDWVESADDALAWVLFDHDAGRAQRTWVRGRLLT
jgi:guanine deaminase